MKYLSLEGWAIQRIRRWGFACTFKLLWLSCHLTFDLLRRGDFVMEMFSKQVEERMEGGQFSSVQSLSRVRLFVVLWTAACQASLSITNSWSLLKLMSIESVMPSNHLILCHPLLLLPSIFPSIRVFSKVRSSHHVAKVLELQHQSFRGIFRINFL